MESHSSQSSGLMQNPFHRSLAFSATVIILAAAACGVLMMLILAQRLVGDRLDLEAKAIEVLAERHMAERFGAEIENGRFRLSMLAAMLEDGASLIAGDPRTQLAINRGDEWHARDAIATELASLGFSDGMLLDHRLTILARMRSLPGLPRAGQRIEGSDLADILNDLLDEAASGAKSKLRRLILLDDGLKHTFEAEGSDAGILVAIPVPGHLGEPPGMLVALRPIRRYEPLLADLARTSGAGVSLLDGEKLVSRAGTSAMDKPPAPNTNGQLIRNPEFGSISRCDALAEGITLCLCRPVSEINAYRDEMTAIGIAQSRRATLLLATSGALGLLVLALVGLHVARFFTRPLVEITGAVDQIAAGNLHGSIRHAEREDEIGRIARALSTMRDKLAERDLLRAEMARIDAINQRRRVLAEALERVETSFGGAIQKLGGTARALHEIKAAIDDARAAADRERERISSSSVATATSAQIVSGATLLLSEGISEIGMRSRITREALQAGSADMAMAGEKLDAARAITDRAGLETAALQNAVGDLASQLLRFARFSGENAGLRGKEAIAFTELTATAQAAAERISSEIATLDHLVGDTAEALHRSQGEVDAARQAAGDIVVTAAEQGVATREVAIGLASAADALANLSAAVDALQSHLLGAHGATDQFSGIARQMIADAEAIDAGIRDFLRDAAA